ncbi:hypothetical protein ASG94_15975 [Nocardioides sp. Soil805]|nr:hypothetical protein ASG94_15975 [Nocardioides sp. Soil805]
MPPGAQRDLVVALHDLHHRAGWPSLRTLARETGVSHTTVSKAFSSPSLPPWGTLELLVEAMRGDTQLFHALWLAASTADASSVPHAPAIAGRTAELAAVRRHLDGGVGLLLVAGEAGIGKTTLVAAAARASDAFVATGRCLPLAMEVPLLPVADCLRSVLETDATWFAEAVAACPPQVADALAALVPEASPRAPTRPDDRLLMTTAVASTVRALARRRPLALLIEDLHWADPGTLDLLEHLLGRELPLPFVGTWRSGDTSTAERSDDWFTRVRRLPRTHVVPLGPLSRTETVEQLRLVGVVSPDQVDRIHARSQGQPLFTEQLAAHLDDATRLPSLLADLLDRRLTGVTVQQWAVLRTLGIASRPLSPDLLAEAASLSADDLTTQLRLLQDRRLVRRAEGSADLQHPLLADAVRRRLVPGEDVAAHAALAHALSKERGAEPGEVAEHWRGAGEVEHEVTWRIAAARAAHARFDRRAEADHLVRVIDLWPDSGDAEEQTVTLADVYLRAMDALRFSFRFDEAAALSEAAGELFDDVDDGVRADLLFRRAIYRGETEGLEVGLALLDETLALCEKLPVRETQARAMDRKQSWLYFIGRTEESYLVASQQVEVATRLADPVLLRDSLMRVAWLAGVAGDVSRAMHGLAESAERAGVADDPLGEIRRGVYATDVLLACGAPADEGLAAGREALSVATSYEIDNPQTMLLRVNVASALVRAGRIAEAERALALPKDAAFEVDRWPAHATLAVIEVRRGRTAAGLERVETVWAALPESAHFEYELLAYRMDVSFWAGVPTRTLDTTLRAIEHTIEGVPVRISAPTLLAAARAATEDEHGRHLRDLAQRSDLLGERHRDDPYLVAHSLTIEAEAERVAGRGRSERWAESAACWELLQRPHDAAYCRWRAAQCAAAEGRGTLAARLLKRATAEARDHVPLVEAIASTSAGAG